MKEPFYNSQVAHWSSRTSWSGMGGSGKWSNPTRLCAINNSLRSSPQSTSQIPRKGNSICMPCLWWLASMMLRAKKLIVTEIKLLRWNGILFRGLENQGVMIGCLSLEAWMPPVSYELEPSSPISVVVGILICCRPSKWYHIARGYVRKNREWGV